VLQVVAHAVEQYNDFHYYIKTMFMCCLQVVAHSVAQHEDHLHTRSISMLGMMARSMANMNVYEPEVLDVLEHLVMRHKASFISPFVSVCQLNVCVPAFVCVRVLGFCVLFGQALAFSVTLHCNITQLLS
jgi:hypothetical protein